jgi:hypothetical protein
MINITNASNPIDPVMRNSTEALGRNFGNIAIPLIMAPNPKDPRSNPKPIESSPSSCLAKSGKRDNSELPHIANKPERTITTCAAWE